MQVHFTIDTLQDSAGHIVKVANALISLADSGEVKTPAKEPLTGEVLPPDEPAPKVNGRAKPAAKAKANGKAKAEPEEKGDDGDEEEGTDYGALRLEIRTRFADWAEQVGMIEGKALLDEFSVGKFSELDNSQLDGFSKKLARLESEM